MSITITRTPTNMIGSPGSPTTVAANGTQSGTLDHTSPAGVFDASIGLVIATGLSAPTTNITVRFAFAEDGTDFVQDGPDISVAAAGSTTYPFRYDPPQAAKASQATVVNGSTNSITVWCQGSTTAAS